MLSKQLIVLDRSLDVVVVFGLIFDIQKLHSPCTPVKTPPEIARVKFSTRANLPGGFGGPGGGFLVVVAVVALPLFLL